MNTLSRIVDKYEYSQVCEKLLAYVIPPSTIVGSLVGMHVLSEDMYDYKPTFIGTVVGTTAGGMGGAAIGAFIVGFHPLMAIVLPISLPMYVYRLHQYSFNKKMNNILDALK